MALAVVACQGAMTSPGHAVPISHPDAPLGGNKGSPGAGTRTGGEGGAAVVEIHADALPGGLHRAQEAARQAIARAVAGTQGAPAVSEVRVLLAPGTHRVERPLQLTAADGGIPGRLRVVWAAADPRNASVVDGGVPITGWQPVTIGDMMTGAAATAAATGIPDAQGASSTSPILSADAPAPLRLPGGGWMPVRNLWIDGVRYNRTRTSAAALGFPDGARMLPGVGFETSSAVPLTWTNPGSVEV